LPLILFPYYIKKILHFQERVFSQFVPTAMLFRSFPLAQAEPQADRRNGISEAQSGRTEKAARVRAGLPFGRIAANGGEARGSAHGGYGVA